MAATDPLSLGLAGAAAVVAMLAAWLQRPVVPKLDGERWFKTALATLVRGAVEADGGDADAWEAAVLRHVPYHPAGRWPERKVSNPAAHPTVALLPGERALLDALSATDDIEERWRILYDRDERGIEARLTDPIELGPDYAPSGAAGAGATWDSLASWARAPAFGAQLIARVGATPVLFPGNEPRLTPALAAAWPGSRILPPGSDLKEALEALLTDASVRLLLVCEGEAIVDVLQLMVDHPGLRDQVLAVVSVGGPIGGRPGAEDERLSPEKREDWMGRWFGQSHLDTERVRLTPYLSLQWLDRSAWPPGTVQQPLHLARFPEPAQQTATVRTIETVDLGPLPIHDDLPLDLVARALWFTVCGWVASRS